MKPSKVFSDPLILGKRPPVDYSSVTDDRHALDANPECAKPPGCLSNGCIKPEQHYACDCRLVKTLAQYVSPEERRKVLQIVQLVPLFTRVPPPSPLNTLRDVINKQLFKKVQIECQKRRLYERVRYEHPDRSVAQRPPDFYGHMPTPIESIFCYGAAFSTLQV